MTASVQRATAAAIAVASGLGLAADDAIVLSDSNRFVVRLLPCDVVARVAPPTHHWSSALEVEVVHRLAATGAPVAPLEPRVPPRIHRYDGFEVALWTHVEPVAPRSLPPDDYAELLEQLHAGLRQVDVDAPHIDDRIAATASDVANRELTPELGDADRALLAGTFRELQGELVERGATEQLLHGEPHPWNVLETSDGPRFIDFENVARGPVEYDLAWVPDAVRDRYPAADLELVGTCRGLVLAIIATHRWRHDDSHPSGRRSGFAFVDALRSGPPWPALDDITW